MREREHVEKAYKIAHVMIVLYVYVHVVELMCCFVAFKVGRCYCA